MSDKITARVLPEKQLRHVLERDGYKFDEDGYYDKVDFCDFASDMFKFCGKEIEAENLDGEYRVYDGKKQWRFLKSWFVPHTLHGKTIDVKREPDMREDMKFYKEEVEKLGLPTMRDRVEAKALSDTLNSEPKTIDFTGTTRPVGDIFPCGGVMLEVVDEVSDCIGCVLMGDASCDSRTVTGECHDTRRSTGKGCIFKEVTKS